ncbi:MAG: ABC transporter ATP-binding protein [Gammaproteobacteria bacterium]|nr:ABC transporter ATP-binding protein [Gammaproteobacteria bacterium]
MSLLEIDGLTIRYADSPAPAVSDLNVVIERGEAIGIVGESGSGKTQTAMAIMGLLPANADVSGSIRFDGTELRGATPTVLNRYRACRIAMVFQDPRTALNPYVRIGKQLRRVLLEHKMCGGAEADVRTLDMLQKVGLPDPERQFRAFPHELSGGMRQRAMIGAALIGEPDLLVADEPTTALDVTVQAQILRLISDLHAETNSALLLITHDLGVVAGNCERVVVMDKGCMVEEGSTREVFSAPVSARTEALLSSAPRIDSEVMSKPIDTDADPVLEIEDIAVSFRGRRSSWGERLHAVKPMSLSLGECETVAVVGESGSGKTSLARAVLGLLPADAGRVSFLGRALPSHVGARRNNVRRHLQMVFQDPLASLNPAMSVREIVAEPLRIHEPGMKKEERNRGVDTMLTRVGLEAELAGRYPHELSGGQAQRVAIARSLILQPKVLICDEAVAALDGTVQHEILKLLLTEQANSGLSLIFITHDLAVVRQISHRVLVMYMGRLCEIAENEALFRRPRHPYTKAVLSSVPVIDPDASAVDVPLAGEAASALSPPTGCPFHPRCPHAIAVCNEKIPELAQCDSTLVACHRAADLDLSY